MSNPAKEPAMSSPVLQIVLITGPSGAGRTTAIRAFEDLGFEVIDNMPASLLPRLLEGPRLERPLAIGLDVRNRDFTVEGVLTIANQIAADSRYQSDLLYLDCDEGELVRRYSETRRRHPLAPFETPLLGIQRERSLLAPIRNAAQHLIDTTGLTVHDLRAEIEQAFSSNAMKGALTLTSFSYKRGLPRSADLVFDCRFLRNPHWSPALRPLDGRNPDVLAYIEEDARFEEFITRIKDLVAFLLPAYQAEGKKHLNIAFGCTGGQHRSVALAELMAKTLEDPDWAVSIRHRELERHTSLSAPRVEQTGQKT